MKRTSRVTTVDVAVWGEGDQGGPRRPLFEITIVSLGSSRLSQVDPPIVPALGAQAAPASAVIARPRNWC